LFFLAASVVILCGGEETVGQSPGSCWTSGNQQGAKWWKEGERIDRGKYWYECKNGELEPRGCFSPTNERLFIGGKYSENGYEMECIVENGYLKFKFTACVPEGQGRKAPGESWEDEKKMYWFTCKQDGAYLKAEIAGCVSHDKSHRLAIGEKYDFQDYTYECMRKYNGSVQMCSVGCMHNGQHYKVGEQWPDGDYVYYCKLENGRCTKVCIGCQFRDKRLYDGDRYQKNDTVFQCEIRPDAYGHKAVACAVKDEQSGVTIERVIGCRWYATTSQGKFEQTCALEDEKAVVKTLGCVFVYKGYDTLFIYPGTYTIWQQAVDGKSLGVACHQNGRLETFDPDQVATRTVGLKFDSPRG